MWSTDDYKCLYKVCLEAEKQCDLTDDCGDKNDELVGCEVRFLSLWYFSMIWKKIQF